MFFDQCSSISARLGSFALGWLIAGTLSLHPSVHAQDDSWKTAIADSHEIAADMREEIVRIPLWQASSEEINQALISTLFQPPGAGPFPVIVLSHGAPGKAADRQVMGRYRLLPQIMALMQRGYAVLVPMRRGYGATGGTYAESFGNCFDAKFEKTGEQSARDLRSAVAFIRSRPELDANRVVLMGQSAGGFASLAAGSLQLPGVVALLNFAGGRGGNGINGLPCSPDAMAGVLAAYARTSKVPALWLYAQNDLYFGPASVSKRHQAYQAAGGNATLVTVAPHGADGHLLFYTQTGQAIWTTELDRFFAAHGLPHLSSNLK